MYRVQSESVRGEAREGSQSLFTDCKLNCVAQLNSKPQSVGLKSLFHFLKCILNCYVSYVQTYLPYKK